ncbi:class I SAM-dependent methyltransferase [Thauera sp. WH-2]|jgi:SAM-dependent methyltransferase|uniref:class I SAM-dependent methyltransferase n=1 Tax=unclassified Thauera TaxID=2609274 RepID=UPI003AAE644B
MSILRLEEWLQTPQGRYLLDWEQSVLDQCLADLFGYYAVQVGLPGIDLLRANRMPQRVRCCATDAGADVLAQPHALPLASGSVDLVVLPHVLEFSPHAHTILREVERVLVPEGSVIVTGLNPLSLWGLRRMMARTGAESPWRGRYRTVMQIRDWLGLLGFEIQHNAFGCYAPPLRTPRWRCLDRAGARWWPVLGAGYMVHGVKRVQGMRLITPHWRGRKASTKRLSPVAQRDGSTRTLL